MSGVVGFIIIMSSFLLMFGTINTFRSLNGKPNYTITGLASSNSINNSLKPRKIMTSKQFHDKYSNTYSRIAQEQKMSGIANRMNAMDCKDGVKNISYNTKTNHFIIKFNTTNPNAQQQKYAQQLLNKVNQH